MATTLGSFREKKFGAALLIVAAVIVGLVLDRWLEALLPDSSIRQLILLVGCNMMVALSLNVINGLAGQFSIGHAGFLAVGAYSAAIVASSLHTSLGSPEPTLLRSFLVVPLSVGVGALFSGVLGFVVGLPSLRLRGDYLAIVTLGFAEIVRLSIATARLGSADETIGHAFSEGGIFHGLSVAFSSLGGQKGYAGPSGQGVPLYAGPFWIVVSTVLIAVFCFRLKFSGWGRALRALREDEIASASVGVDPTRYKVTSFVLSSALAGVAGGMLALMRDGNPVVQPDSFTFQASFDAITMVILGGSGSVIGCMVGAIFVTVTVKLIELLQGIDAVVAARTSLDAIGIPLDLNALRMMIYAVVLIVLMIVRPEGLFGEREPGFETKRMKKDGATKKEVTT